VSPAFAVWLTGLPASGKSTITRALVRELALRGMPVAVMESDVLRAILTPDATYGDDERDAFYRALAALGALLVTQGVPVVFDATANRRVYRDAARTAIGHFLEVHVECPLEVCIARDPKGIYRKAQAGGAATVPGLQASYEPPVHPDVTVSGTGDAQEAVRQVVKALEDRGFLTLPGVSVARAAKSPALSCRPASGSGLCGVAACRARAWRARRCRRQPQGPGRPSFPGRS